MKRVLAAIVTCSILISIVSVPVSAVDVERDGEKLSGSSVTAFEEMFPSEFDYSTSYTDEEGNEGEILFTNVSGKTFVEVFVNSQLTQRAIAAPEEDIVMWIQYPREEEPTSVNRRAGNMTPVLQEEKYSDFISDIVIADQDTSEKEEPEISTFAFSTEGWAYLLSVPSNATITGSKPCTVYSRNYDDEPDLHRYYAKQVKFGVGTAIGAIVSVLSVFLTGGVTVQAIIIALGSGIASDVITQAITGEVCFSTQKIRYAPVIGGNNIFPDAYITKRWVIIYDAIDRRESFKLDNASYEYNRGQNPYQIAYNAQMAEANS